MKFKLGKYILTSLFVFYSATNITDVYAFSGNDSVAQLNGGKTVVENAHDLLQEANGLKYNSSQKSAELATKALNLAHQTNNYLFIGQAHSLLGWLADRVKNTQSAKEHYLGSYTAYQKTADKRNEILNGLEYAELLFKGKDKTASRQLIDKLLLRAYDIEDHILIAKTMLLKGEINYKQKSYLEAEAVLSDSLQFLKPDDIEANVTRGSVYHLIGQVFKQIKDYDKAITFHEKALEVRKKIGDLSLIARSTKNLAIIEFKRHNLRTTLDYAFQSIEIQKQLSNNEDHAELLVLIGSTYRQLLRYDTSLEYLNKALQMYKEINNIGRIAESLNQIGLLYIRLGKLDEALALYQEAIELPHDQVPSKILAVSYREIARLELMKGKDKYALLMAKTAHDIFVEDKDLLKASKTARIVGEIYDIQGKLEQAIIMFAEALNLAEVSNSDLDKAKVLNSLGYTLVKTNIDEALTIFERALSIANLRNYKAEKASALNAIINIHKTKENYHQALIAAEALIEVSESIHRLQEKNKLAFAKASLESHLLETELDSLKEKMQLDQLTLVKKNNEIEIVQQANKISELELVKNRYANFLLFSLLIICLSTVVYFTRIFKVSRERNKELKYLATHDPLTDCYNRRGLFENTDRQFELIATNAEYSFVVADIDHFKEVNDAYGHDAGDKVLIEVVQLLKDCVPNNAIVARLGGEEFCVALPNTTISQAETITEKMRKSIADTQFSEIKVTCSFGIAGYDAENDSPGKLITKADRALYSSKSNGRNRITIWDNSLS